MIYFWWENPKMSKNRFDKCKKYRNDIEQERKAKLLEEAEKRKRKYQEESQEVQGIGQYNVFFIVNLNIACCSKMRLRLIQIPQKVLYTKA